MVRSEPVFARRAPACLRARLRPVHRIGGRLRSSSSRTHPGSIPSPDSGSGSGGISHPGHPRRRAQVLQGLLLPLLLEMTACRGLDARLEKVLLPRDYSYQMRGEPPAIVTFVDGYRGGLPERYDPPHVDASGVRPASSPPTVTREGWIQVTPVRGRLQTRLFVHNEEVAPSSFFEVKTVVGDREGERASEVRILDGITPGEESRRYTLSNLKSPYNPYAVYDGALVLLEVTDIETWNTWHYLFVYKDFGSRTKLSFNLLIGVPPSLLAPLGLETSDLSTGNAAFTVSYSYGYRFPTRNPVLRWFGDKVAVVSLLGISATPVVSFEPQMFSQLSLGLGIEWYDFLSLNLLMGATDLRQPGRSLEEGKVGVAIGFDAVRAADFTRQITQKLSRSHPLK